MGIDKRMEDDKAALSGATTHEPVEYAWYVGASIDEDLTETFIAEGRWENGGIDSRVNSMQIGDRIVIKSAYRRRRGLPFKSNGRDIGVMAIKAIGTITGNAGDGKNVTVDWEKVEPKKEWYGDGCLRQTVHYIRAADSYIKKALLAFTFEGMEQDYSVFEDEAEEDDDAVAEGAAEIAASDESENALPERKPGAPGTHDLNTILYGAPGTGKTYSTAEYALAIIENRAVDLTQKTVTEREALMAKYKNYVAQKRIVFTTFHQSYGYEDFVQGLRIDTSADKMKFKPMDGAFKRIANRAMSDPDNNYVIIIDEINRANISKVFGELITLIEADKRWGEINAISVTLPSGEPFAVPNNLYLIGTMNSADKSISLIDTALRRRFSFTEVKPDYSTVTDSDLRKVLKMLNDNLAEELASTDLLIGHAYFIGKTISDLCDVMNKSIIPLLYEYFYDNAKKVKEQVKKAIDGLPYQIEDDKIGRIRLV